jgi:AcrR family transcriptional regulator
VETPNDSERKKETAGPISRRDRRRAETRDRLFAAAIRMLSEHEFDYVTVEMITEAADVGKGTFFNYFKNKEGILSFYFERQLRLLTETLQAAASGTPLKDWPAAHQGEHHEGGPFWRKIVAIVHESAERRVKEKHFTRTLLSLSLTNPQVRAANLEFRKRIIEVICGLIEEAQTHGELRNDLTADVLASFMFGTYLGALYMWSQSESDESLHLVIDKAFARVWSGIRSEQ